jgi:hypothetical protein
MILQPVCLLSNSCLWAGLSTVETPCGVWDSAGPTPHEQRDQHDHDEDGRLAQRGVVHETEDEAVDQGVDDGRDCHMAQPVRPAAAIAVVVGERDQVAHAPGFLMIRGVLNYRGIRQYRTLLKSEETLQLINFERHELVPRTAADGEACRETGPRAPPRREPTAYIVSGAAAAPEGYQGPYYRRVSARIDCAPPCYAEGIELSQNEWFQGHVGARTKADWFCPCSPFAQAWVYTERRQLPVSWHDQ